MIGVAEATARIATPSNEALLREALEAARDFLANQRLPLTVKRLAVIAKIDAALNPPGVE